jgi:hypothetical protein
MKKIYNLILIIICVLFISACSSPKKKYVIEFMNKDLEVLESVFVEEGEGLSEFPIIDIEGYYYVWDTSIEELQDIREDKIVIGSKKEYYKNVKYSDDIEQKSEFTKYIVDKFIIMTKEIQGSFAQVKEINQNAVLSITSACRYIIFYYTYTKFVLTRRKVGRMNEVVRQFVYTSQYLKNVDFKIATPLIIWGVAGAIAGSFLAGSMPSDMLRKIFAYLLLITGVYQIAVPLWNRFKK